MLAVSPLLNLGGFYSIGNLVHLSKYIFNKIGFFQRGSKFICPFEERWQEKADRHTMLKTCHLTGNVTEERKELS